MTDRVQQALDFLREAANAPTKEDQAQVLASIGIGFGLVAIAEELAKFQAVAVEERDT